MVFWLVLQHWIPGQYNVTRSAHCIQARRPPRAHPATGYHFMVPGTPIEAVQLQHCLGHRLAPNRFPFLGEEAEDSEECKSQDSPCSPLPPPVPATDPKSWQCLVKRYTQIAAAACLRGADGKTDVPDCPEDACWYTRSAHEDALKAVADARRRASARHQRRHGPVVVVRA